MKEQFVPYEIAIKLKEKGFDEPCFGVYIINDVYTPNAILKPGTLSIIGPVKKGYVHDDCIPAPLWQQVIDWLREGHNLRVFESTPISGLSSKSFNEDFRFELVKISGNGGHANSVYGNGGLGSRYRTYSSYNEARQAAIEHALTLI